MQTIFDATKRHILKTRYCILRLNDFSRFFTSDPYPLVQSYSCFTPDERSEGTYLGPLWGLPHWEAEAPLAALRDRGLPPLTEQVSGVEEGAILQVVNTRYLPLLETFTTRDGAGPPIPCHPPVDDSRQSQVCAVQRTKQQIGWRKEIHRLIWSYGQNLLYFISHNKMDKKCKNKS